MLYVFCIFLAFMGFVALYAEGYSKYSIAFIIIGLFPFVARSLVVFSENLKTSRTLRQKRKELEQKSKPVIASNDRSQPTYDPYYVSSLAQAKIERLERELELYKTGLNASFVPQSRAENSERKSAESTSVFNKFDNQGVTELANTKAKLRNLEAEYDKLYNSYMALISKPIVDEEAEMEIKWLREENARLQSCLSASENAVAVLNQQLEDLRKKV